MANCEEHILTGGKVSLDGRKGMGEEVFTKMTLHGDSIAMIDEETGDRITFRTLRDNAITIALALRAKGVTIEDVVTLVEKTSIEAFTIILGCMFVGARFNVLDAGVTAPVILPLQFTTLKPKVIFCHSSAEELAQRIVKGNNLASEVIVYDGRSKCSNKTYEDVVDQFGRTPEDVNKFKPTEIKDIKKTAACICCTSGSTGNPKGVLITHSALHHLMLHINEKDFQGKAIFTYSGMSWGSGIFMLIVGVLSGAFRVYSRKPFSEDKLLHIMHKYRPGFMLLSCYQVSLLNAFLQDKPHLAKAFSEVEMLYAVGSKISPKQFETTQKHLGSGKLLVWYGMTECVNGTNTILCPEYRPHTVGKVCINTELKILSLETGQTLGPNKQGEIYLRGPTMLGYFDNPEATAQVLDAKTGWFKTGDIGYYDEDGYVYVMDRIKEIAKYKGIYVNPSDIEDVVCQHPDVRGCAVVSVPHDEVCDLMVGYVELLPGHENNVSAQELEQYTNERVQDYEKLRGGLYIVKTLPVLTNGKKDKTTVRKIAKDMTNQIYDRYNSIVSSKG